MSNYHIADRRKHKRVVSNVQIELRTSGNRRSYHFTHDISRGGLFVIANESPKVGTTARFELLLDGVTTKLGLNAVIVRDDMGVSVDQTEMPASAVRIVRNSIPSGPHVNPYR